MKQVKKIPQEGQFVAIWEYKGKLWSSTYKWQDGVLLAYSAGCDEFMYPLDVGAPSKQRLIELSATYFIAEQ